MSSNSTQVKFTLNNGLTIPVIGLGTWQIKPEDVEKVVGVAIDVGYRQFDCAPVYQNEEKIGEVIGKSIALGTVKREDLYIITKLPPPRNTPQQVRESLVGCLKALKVNYVDLFLIHNAVSINWEHLMKLGGPSFAIKKPEDPSNFYNKIDHIDVWREMEKLVDEGLVKSIGVSNFNEKQVQNLLDNGRIKPVALEVECHAHFPQEELASFCEKNQMIMIAYAPLGSPARWGGNATGPVLLEEPILTLIGKKYGKTPAQVLLRWLIMRHIVVLPKTSNTDRLRENFDVMNFQLSAADMAEIGKLKARGGRLFGFDMWKESPHYPF